MCVSESASGCRDAFHYNTEKCGEAIKKQTRVLSGSGLPWGTGRRFAGHAKDRRKQSLSSKQGVGDHNSFVGLLGTKGPNAALTNIGAAANDKTDSWENKSGTNGRWYYHSNSGGNCHTAWGRRKGSDSAW